MHLVKLPYLKLPNPDPHKEFITVPWIPVTIRVSDREQTFLMLIDSGADNCIFDKDIADFMDINLEDGALVKTGGLSGFSNVYYFDNIYINVGGYEIKTRAGFIDGNLVDGKIAGILGRQGFFDYFKVCIDEKRKEIELKSR